MILNTIVGGGGGGLSVPKALDSNNKLINAAAPVIDISGINDIGDYALMGAYANTAATVLYGLLWYGFSITGEYACYKMFYGCQQLSGARINAVAFGNHSCEEMFANCYGRLESGSVNAGINTGTIQGECACRRMFAGCTRLNWTNGLTASEISGESACEEMYSGCTGMTAFSIGVKQVTGEYALRGMLKGCTSLENVYVTYLQSGGFGHVYTNQLTDFLYGVDGCTIHFPSNLDPQTGDTTISDLDGYPNFGGTNTVLVYDQTASNN